MQMTEICFKKQQTKNKNCRTGWLQPHCVKHGDLTLTEEHWVVKVQGSMITKRACADECWLLMEDRKGGRIRLHPIKQLWKSNEIKSIHQLSIFAHPPHKRLKAGAWDQKLLCLWQQIMIWTLTPPHPWRELLGKKKKKKKSENPLKNYIIITSYKTDTL